MDSPILPGAFREVRLDLGCGKGAFTIASALREPEVLFMGIDVDPVCTAFAARMATESKAQNVVFLPGRNGTLRDTFAEGELSEICLNFPTPYPKARQAHSRLTHASHLLEYRRILKKDGRLFLQTDNQALFAYSIEQLREAGFRLLRATEDARAEFPSVPETDYGRRAVAAGAKIHALWATPGPLPQTTGQPCPASLYAYLPDNLDGLDYVPPEMMRAVAAMRR